MSQTDITNAAHRADKLYKKLSQMDENLDAIIRTLDADRTLQAQQLLHLQAIAERMTTDREITKSQWEWLKEQKNALIG